MIDSIKILSAIFAIFFGGFFLGIEIIKTINKKL